ncbi:hypothetical protein BVI434_1230044 [Burkholderia vietnamiensis]|nr:hypothetical protein BVI434_1230044 [Burkholderia vietnamiensis]
MKFRCTVLKVMASEAIAHLRVRRKFYAGQLCDAALSPSL